MTPREGIERERRRQVEAEGWSAEHDDARRTGEFTEAAIAYYLSGTSGVQMSSATGAPVNWPFSPAWWKPHGKRRDLVRAGALILAERDRLQRLEPNADLLVCESWLQFIEKALKATPRRVRASRAKGAKLPPGAVYIGRPTPYGNPWAVGLKACGCRSAGECSHNAFRVETAEEAVGEFRTWIEGARKIQGNRVAQHLEALRGRDLACWCKLDRPCHGDVWLELANPSAVLP